MPPFKPTNNLVIILSYYACFLTVSNSGSNAPTDQPINFYNLPGVVEESYSQIGDINIGNLAITKQRTDRPATWCSKKTVGLSYSSDTTEAIAFAVDLVNRDPNLLPNITLGFVIRGVCNSPNVALAASLFFLPRSKHYYSSDGGCYSNRHTSCSSNNCTTCASTQAMMTSQEDSKWLNDDVIGLISPDKDDLTTKISSLYSVARLPIVGVTEVGDELSNKETHPYFFRIVPPNQYQIKAVLRFIASNKWSYISIVYKDDPYGKTAYERMDRTVAKYGICIATSHMLDSNTDYDELAANLLTDHSRARVVVLFSFAPGFRRLLMGIETHNATGRFIIVATDAVTRYHGVKFYGTPDDPAIGVFVISLYYNFVMEFYDHLLKQKVATTKNPWLRAAYEYIMECSYDTNQTKIKLCNPLRNLFMTYRYRTYKETSFRIDAVLTLAHAAHNLLQEKCPNATGQDARDCITGPLLRDYLMKTNFDGYNGHIEFDENQDVKGRYTIGQYVYDYLDYSFTTNRRFKHMTTKKVGVYDALNDTISYYQNEPITWSHLKVVKRIVPLMNDSSLISPNSLFSSFPSSSSSSSFPSSSSSSSSFPSSSSTSSSSPYLPSLNPEIPESVCSRPCVIGEYKIEKDVPCCWECRRCRENEHIIDKGNTSCEACPKFTWPDPESGFTSCIDIPPTYPSFQDTISIVLTSIAILCLVISVVVFIVYNIIYRNAKVIKASSRELSVIQLVAILTGYVTVIVYQTTPTDVTCVAIFFMFCMSFSLLYCPLLVKTIRIYRIFTMGIQVEPPRFISNTAQLVLSACLVTVQVSLCIADYIIYHPQARRSQPIWTEKFVELSCDLTFPGLLSFLVYNILQVMVCSVFAFKVRQLPDNFNESRYISMCVSTTLLIWLAFIPTYYTAHRENVRTFLLCMALLINHSVALFLLFLPKLYAARFIPQTATGRNTTKRLSSLNSGIQTITDKVST